MYAVTVDDNMLDRITDVPYATEQQIGKAQTSALRKIRKRIETRIKQAAAKKLRIPQKAIADRFFSSRVEPGDEDVNVWVGTWAVSPFSIGTPKQTVTGVKSGRRFYPGAFIASIYTAQEKVWIRLHSTHYSPELYPTKRRPGDRGLGDYRGRFPVVRAAVPIDGVISEVIEKEGEAIATEFEKIFSQELNYYANVQGQL